MDSLCKICERVPFGLVVHLGFGHWRHDYCAIGSIEWHAYYERQSKADKAKLVEFATYHEVK